MDVPDIMLLKSGSVHGSFGRCLSTNGFPRTGLPHGFSGGGSESGLSEPGHVHGMAVRGSFSSLLLLSGVVDGMAGSDLSGSGLP